jgi:hypothetical protein
MVVHACNLSTSEAESGVLWIKKPAWAGLEKEEKKPGWGVGGGREEKKERKECGQGRDTDEPQ